MPELIRNQTAYDKALRRAANRKQRAEGGKQLDLAKMQKRAEHDVKLRCKLGEQAKGTDAAALAARIARRKLNDSWTNRNARSLGDYWNPEERRAARY